MSGIFYFKYFAVLQHKDVMKVGTDSMLLGAWTDSGNAKTILDIGTGTGVLSLMLAQKSDALIDAIEPDSKAFELAGLNFNRSRWKNRIRVFNSSLQEFVITHRPDFAEGYDLIISNPPFYKPYLRYGKQAPTEKRRKIRSHEGLKPQELLEHSLKLLSPEGQFSLILPVETMEGFIQMAKEKGLWLNKKLLIKSKPGSGPIRCIALFSRVKKQLMEDEISIHRPDGSYSEAYLELTKEYHVFNLKS